MWSTYFRHGSASHLTLNERGLAGKGFRGNSYDGFSLRRHPYNTSMQGHGPYGAMPCLTSELRTLLLNQAAEPSAANSQVFFCEGCRYRVTAYPHWTVASVSLANAAFCSGLCLWHLAELTIELRRSRRHCGPVAFRELTSP